MWLPLPHGKPFLPVVLRQRLGLYCPRSQRLCSGVTLTGLRENPSTCIAHDAFRQFAGHARRKAPCWSSLREMLFLSPLNATASAEERVFPTWSTDACRRTDCVSRREPATAGTWRPTSTRKGPTEATKQQNHTTFPREYAGWDRSILCQRCGAVFHAANLNQSLCNQVCRLRRICVTARARRQV